MPKSDRYVKKTDFDPERQRKGQEKAAEHRKLMAERKKFKRNQKPKGPRRHDWTPGELDAETLDNLDVNEYTSFQRVMPRDEGERRRALELAAFARSTIQEPAVDAEEADELAENPDLVQGRVVAIASALCRVMIREQTILCNIRGVLHAQETGFTNAVAVGDQVLVRKEGDSSGVVEKVLPRRSLLARPDGFYPHLRQIVVSNADQLLIVASWRDPIIWFELIDRYLVAAARNGLPAIICINKIDLATSHADVENDLRPYLELGIPCLFTSAQSGAGIDELHARLSGRTTVLAGLSGVGKSSLLSAVQPGLNLRVGVVSEHSGEGRHTTTQALSLRLDEQTWVVDTPGIRDFGLSGMVRTDLIDYFPELAEAAKACRFRNCTHHDEPGCAVKIGVATGDIAANRMHSFRLIYASLPA